MMFYIQTVVFMAFLAVAAWQDYKNGTVSLALLSASVSVTLVLRIMDAGIIGAVADERVAYAIGVMALLLWLMKRQMMGGADVIILTQITFLYGIISFALILALAAVTVLAVAGVKCLASPDKTTLQAFRKHEIRFIPHIALAAPVLLLTGMYPI